jgi:hypothetical protein
MDRGASQTQLQNACISGEIGMRQWLAGFVSGQQRAQDSAQFPLDQVDSKEQQQDRKCGLYNSNQS